MGWRLVGSLLSLIPLPESLCAVGFAVQGVLLNLPHELPPVSAEEGVEVRRYGVEGTDRLFNVRDGQEDSATSCCEAIGVTGKRVAKVASPKGSRATVPCTRRFRPRDRASASPAEARSTPIAVPYSSSQSR